MKRRFTKRVGSFMLAACILITGAVNTQAGHWADEAVGELSQTYGGGKFFASDEPATRADVRTVLSGTFFIPPSEVDTVVVGGDGEQITFKEVCAAIMLIGKFPVSNNTQFTDVGDLPEHYRDSIITLADLGIIYVNPDKKANPDGTISKGDFAALVYRTVNKIGGLGQGAYVNVKPGLWYYDAMMWAIGNGKFGFDVDNNINPEAIFTSSSSLQPQTYAQYAMDEYVQSGGRRRYLDVSPTDWFYDGVMYLTDKGFVSGSAAGIYNPHVELTHTQLATVMSRIFSKRNGWITAEENSPNFPTQAQFNSVFPGVPYYGQDPMGNQVYYIFLRSLWEMHLNGKLNGMDAQSWTASSTDIFSGSKATREEMAQFAVMLYEDYDLSKINPSVLNKAKDKDQIKDSHKMAMAYLVSAGVINGSDINGLRPKSVTTRAEMGVFLSRVLQGIDKSKMKDYENAAKNSAYITLTEDWRLTDILDLDVGNVKTLVLDGQDRYSIYEMSQDANLVNTGNGLVSIQRTTLYNAGLSPKSGSLAELLEKAHQISYVPSPAKDATSLTLPTVNGFTVGIKTSDKPDVIAVNGTIAPPVYDTTVQLVLTLTGNGGIVETGILSVAVPARSTSTVDSGSSNDTSPGSTSDSNTNPTGSTPSITPTPAPTTAVEGSTIVTVSNTNRNGKTTAGVSIANVTTAMANGTKTVEIQVQTPSNSVSSEITIPKDAFSALVDKKAEKLVIHTQDLTITYDDKAISSILSQAGDMVKINITKVSEKTQSDLQKKTANGRPVYDFTILSQDQIISNFGNGTVEISLPYNANKAENSNSIVIYYVNENGRQLVESGVYNEASQNINFAINHFSVYAVGYNPVSFSDISNHWGKDYIEKAAARKLVNGVGNGLYDPDRSITRAEFVQMMSNLLKLPEDKTATQQYSDVSPDAWYYKAVVKAQAAGLLKKFTDSDFKPSQPITREEMASIIAAALRAQNKTVLTQTATIRKDFTDYGMIDAAYLADAELVYQNKIMSGMGNGEFNPKGHTTRAQAAIIQMNMLGIK